MKKFVIAALVAAGLASGCHGLTEEIKTDIRDNAAAGDRLLNRWDQTSDATKKAFVLEFVTCGFTACWTFDGTKPPAAYITTATAAKAGK